MTHRDDRTLFTLEEIATRCGVEHTFVKVLLEYGVIESAHQQPLLVAAEVTLRVNKVARLQRDLGVNVQGASVILQLLERIEELEHELGARRR